MKVVVAIVALIAMSVANIASAQYIVLRKCGFSSGASLIESDASSHASSKINSVQARIAAAVQAPGVQPGDPIFAKLKAAKAPYTVKTIVPRHNYGRNPKTYFPVPASLQSRLVKVWPSCPAGADPHAAWAGAWNAIAQSFTDLYGNTVDQTFYFVGAIDVYAVAKAACDVNVKEGISAPAVTGASIEPNGDCRVNLKFDQSLAKFQTAVPYEGFERYVKK